MFRYMSSQVPMTHSQTYEVRRGTRLALVQLDYGSYSDYSLNMLIWTMICLFIMVLMMIIFRNMVRVVHAFKPAKVAQSNDLDLETLPESFR